MGVGMEVVLYSANGSNSSERVEWALNYKEISYQRIEISSEELATSYLDINPFGYVPSLSVNGAILSESMAILEYLEECFSGRSLLGNTPFERAQVRRVCEYVNSSIHSPQNKTVLRFLRPELDDLSKKTLRGEWITQCLDTLSSSICLESNYAIGQHFSLADIFVASIYKKALQHGATEKVFYAQYLSFLRSHSDIAASEPKS